MAELKYTYALDKNENCIGIGNAQKGIEYRCPHCKGEMVVKEGSIKVKHYAHKIRLQNCSYETYLQIWYLQPIITQYFIDNKSEIWLLFLIAHSKR